MAVFETLIGMLRALRLGPRLARAQDRNRQAAARLDAAVREVLKK